MKKHWWKITLIVFVAAVVSFLLIKKKHKPTPTQPTDYLSRLHLEELRNGNGPAAVESSRVRIHYVEWIMAGGKMIDSTYQRLLPSEFTLNSPDLIQGLKDGIIGMKVGGKRKLIIPPHLAYGKQAVGNIPPNSHLVFEVELLDLLPDLVPSPVANPSKNKTTSPSPTINRQKPKGKK